MALEIEATYDNGVIKLDKNLPLENGQRVRVRVTVRQPSGRARASAGIFPWQGERKDLESLLSPDNQPWNANE